MKNNYVPSTAINENQFVWIEKQFLLLNAKERKQKLIWIQERLKEMKAGTFYAARYLNESIRFWAAEHQELVKKYS